MNNNDKEGKYFYCIIRNSQFTEFGAMGIGSRNDKVYTVSFRDISAVVSDTPVKKYDLERDNLLCHEMVIEEVMKHYTVLPVRFATVAENEEKIKRILEREYDKFFNLLENMEGKKELGLKALFKPNVIFMDILNKYDDIRNLKEKIESLPPEASYYQRMKIGEMVETAFQKEKELYKNEFLNSLSPLAVEVKINNTFGDRMILNTAFLVEKCKESEFDQTVNRLADKYDDKMKIMYVGTLPPFSFVNIVVKADNY